MADTAGECALATAAAGLHHTLIAMENAFVFACGDNSNGQQRLWCWP